MSRAQLIGVNVALSVFCCLLYIADTYERNRNTELDQASSPLLDSYITTDFAVSMCFVAIFVMRR